MENSLSPTRRLIAPDALRGLIMIFMALDHANHFIAQKHSPGEYWGGNFPQYQDALSFLVRWVTHLSAPGFFFLMGLGMWLFARSRSEKGWSNWQIIGYFTLRGSILIALQFYVINPAWERSPGGWVLQNYVGVLFALGAAMILLGTLTLFDYRILIPITILLLFANGFFPPSTNEWNTGFSLAQRLLAIPGGDMTLWVNYPVLPWVPLVTLGMLFGHWLCKDRDKAYLRALSLGAVSLIVFLITRQLGDFWNLRPLPINDWIDFLNIVKYPPSLTFIFMTMSINLLILWTFSKADKLLLRPLLAFGRVPLFFYVIHLYLFAFIGNTSFARSGTSIAMMLPIWIIGLFILYSLCILYGRLKKIKTLKPILQFF